MEKTIYLFDSETKSRVEVSANEVGKELKAICPKHDDKNASLSINEEKKVYHCFGCEWSGQLWDDDKAPKDSGEGDPKGIEECRYDYRDRQGNLVYWNIRFRNPKDFRQYRPDGHGGEIKGIKGVNRVPYRLPELLTEDDPVFITEGEKDCDNLRAFGFTATTNAGGAKSWEQGFAYYLHGRDVIITYHNDEPGKERIDLVAKTLQGIAKSIKVLHLPNLPEHGDISDWLKANPEIKTSQEFWLVTAKWLVVWKEAEKGKKHLERKPISYFLSLPSPEPIIKDFGLFVGYTYMLDGDSGTYKSLTAHVICKSVLLKMPLFGAFEVQKSGPAVIFDEETPADMLGQRLRRHGINDSMPISIFNFSGLQLDDNEWIGEVRRALKEANPKLVIFDSLTRFHNSEESKGPKGITPIMSLIKSLAQEFQCAIIIIHHFAKAKDNKTPRGSGDLMAAVILEYQLQQEGNRQDHRFSITCGKCNIRPIENIFIKVDGLDDRSDEQPISMKYEGTVSGTLWERVWKILQDNNGIVATNKNPIPFSEMGHK